MHSDIEHYEAFLERQKMRTIAAAPASGIRDSLQSSQKQPTRKTGDNTNVETSTIKMGDET